MVRLVLSRYCRAAGAPAAGRLGLMRASVVAAGADQGKDDGMRSEVVACQPERRFAAKSYAGLASMPPASRSMWGRRELEGDTDRRGVSDPHSWAGNRPLQFRGGSLTPRLLLEWAIWRRQRTPLAARSSHCKCATMKRF